MKIVILLSTYNGEKYIDKQLESIYKQNINAQLLLYVRDDGSSDKTVEKVNKWKDRINIRWADSSKNLRSAKSFWYLLENAPEADFYAFCDQDDFWYKDKLDKAVKTIKNIKQDDTSILYFSNSRMVDENLQPINATTYPGIPILRVSAQLVCGTCQGSTMVMNFKCRQMLLDKKIENLVMHDLTSILYTIINGRVIYDEQPYLDYRQHENNVESNINKSLFAHVKQVYGRWIKNKHLMSNQAAEILEKCGELLNEYDRDFCKNVVVYRKSFAAKRYLLSNASSYSNGKSAIRSFKIRILLNLF
ncbi:glycosyltransferase [uncultured Clostridium sp.]|uniref:glycosyltransferase n=1 Tax=uncultured Clostridium sp. TaxID=59620 RepID=UPI0025DFBC3F|nr:glycosyltransferase [uncultured Clostridium sp.]